MQDAEKSLRIANSATEDFVNFASVIKGNILIIVFVWNAEKNLRERQITNTDVIFVRKKPIKPQHVRGREDIENAKVTVQIKKVNRPKCQKSLIYKDFLKLLFLLYGGDI